MITVNPRLIQNIAVLVAAALLFWTIYVGFKDGRDIAQSTVTAKNTMAVLRGMSYFMQDQSRFPSRSEFTDSVLMKRYFNEFPPRSFLGKKCTMESEYKTDNFKDFSYTFCIPRSSEPYNQGTNTVTDLSQF